MTGKENASAYQHRRILEDDDDEVENKSYFTAKGDIFIDTTKANLEDTPGKESVQPNYSTSHLESSKHTQILTEIGESFLRGLDTMGLDVDDGISLPDDTHSEITVAKSVNFSHNISATQNRSNNFMAVVMDKLKRVRVMYM